VFNIIFISEKSKSRPCYYVRKHTRCIKFFLNLCHSRFLPYGFYGTFSVGRFSLPIPLPILSFLQVVRRGSGALSPATHAYSTSHSQTYTTLIHPWAPFPDGTRTRADLAVVAERVLIFPTTTLPSAPRRHTHTSMARRRFLPWKKSSPSVRFELTSIGTATSEYFLRQPCGHRATCIKLLSLFIAELFYKLQGPCKEKLF
jgi:hypothetical protein